jgi:hypothetical protein
MFSEWKILVMMHFSSDAAAEPVPHHSPSASLRLGIRDSISWVMQLLRKGISIARNYFQSLAE